MVHLKKNYEKYLVKSIVIIAHAAMETDCACSIVHVKRSHYIVLAWEDRGGERQRLEWKLVGDRRNDERDRDS